MVPCAVAEPFGLTAVFPEALSLPFLNDAADFPAIRIVFDADAHIAEPFPIQEIELFVGQFPGSVEDELGFGEAEEVVSVLHEHVVLQG